MRVFELATSIPWAIREDALQTILEIASRQNPTIELVEAKLGRKLDNTRKVSIRDGVAVIPVNGPIFRYANLFTDVSGATSLEVLAKDFDSALNNKDVKSIMFNIDSPGGEAIGINEFAEQIFDARGKKPIVAYVGGSGCSAAYWIASACDEIVTDETAVLGSIGVAAVVKDTEEKEAKAGIKNIKFVSKKSPNKRPDLTTDEGREHLQTNIDAIADVFIGKVARNRTSALKYDLNSDDVVERFGRGGTLVGADAVRVGLADRLGSFEKTLESLIQSGAGGSSAISLTNNEDASMKLRDRLYALLGEVDAELAAEKSAKAGDAQPNADAPEIEGFELVRAEDGSVVRGENGKPVYKALEPVVRQATEDEENNEALLQATSTIEALRTELGGLRTQLSDLEGVVAGLRAEAAAKLEETINLNAKLAAAKLFSAEKLTPAKEEKFVKAYVIAAKDDAANPIEGVSRVETLLAQYEEAEPHMMTRELHEPKIITNNVEDDDEEGIKKMLSGLDNAVEKYAAGMNKVLESRKNAKATR